MTRGLLPRLLALLAVVLLGTWYVLTQVLQFSFGRGPYDVTLELPRAGGIYENATVTYNGVNVGSVTGIDVATDLVRVTLAIDRDRSIPSDVDAQVRQLSAVGEQYVDLVPASADGPALEEGSVIPADRASVPVAIGTALDDLGALLDSLDEQNLTTVQDFLASGFIGTGPDLRSLVVNSQQLTRALQAAQPATVDLITQGTPVLQTLNDTNQQFADYTRNLNVLTAQLKASDADLRALLANGAPATEQVTDLLVRTRDDIAGTVAGLASGSEAVLQYEPQVQRIFQMLPVVAQDLRAVTASGTIRTTLAVNGTGPICTYLLPQQIPLPTERTGAADTDNRCRTPGVLPRGADSAPGPVTAP